MSAFTVEIIEGYIDDDEPHTGGAFHFESYSLKLTTIPAQSIGEALITCNIIQLAYDSDPHWEKVVSEGTCGQSMYAQFRHKDLRSKILSIFTSKGA